MEVYYIVDVFAYICVASVMCQMYAYMWRPPTMKHNCVFLYCTIPINWTLPYSIRVVYIYTG